VLQYVAPVCVVLIFFLQFFPWVGDYPGGVSVATQGAWGAAFGSPREVSSANVLTLFYLLLFLFGALPLTVFCIVLDFVPVKLPPHIKALLPWRWGIVSVVNLVVFLFLLLQLLVGFSLESFYANKFKTDVDLHLDARSSHVTGSDARQTGGEAKLLEEIQRGIAEQSVARTAWLAWVVILHLLAIGSAALVYWIGQRGDRSLPKIELQW
jgi:hypothetical protein